GVQTCALPILAKLEGKQRPEVHLRVPAERRAWRRLASSAHLPAQGGLAVNPQPRLLGLPVLILLLACGGPAPELGLGGPSTAEAIWGSATSLKFTLERNETATGEVTL